jgi:hypothetical protein
MSTHSPHPDRLMTTDAPRPGGASCVPVDAAQHLPAASGYLRFFRQTLISARTLAELLSRSSETESRKSASAFDFVSV